MANVDVTNEPGELWQLVFDDGRFFLQISGIKDLPRAREINNAFASNGNMPELTQAGEGNNRVAVWLD